MPDAAPEIAALNRLKAGWNRAVDSAITAMETGDYTTAVRGMEQAATICREINAPSRALPLPPSGRTAVRATRALKQMHETVEDIIAGLKYFEGAMAVGDIVSAREWQSVLSSNISELSYSMQERRMEINRKGV